MTRKHLLLAGCAAIAGSLPVASCKVVAPWDPLAQCLPPDPPPFYLWVGPAADAPSACHERNPVKLFEAHAGVIQGAFSCPECSCGASTTECTPPLEWTVVARTCVEAPGAQEVFFGGPASWNGICSTQTKIAAGLECAGGEPCTQSMVVGTPELLAAPCAPSPVGAPVLEASPWSWETVAIACTDEATLGQEDSCDHGYVRVHGPPEDYRVCVERTGTACPLEFTDQLTLYFGAEDERGCAPCSCGEPEGNTCSFKVTAFSDEACGSEAGVAFVTSGEEVCFDLPDGTALGSKNAELVASTPGTCAPGGGEPIGEVVPASPVDFCCQPHWR